MITREQVADLRPGDVVEITWPEYADYTARGPIRVDGGNLYAGPSLIRWGDGNLSTWTGTATLTIVSRAPRPLYVNHDRTEPVPGDVAGPAETGANDGQTWHFLDGIGSQWFDKRGYGLARDELPARLRLLVDGETGQVAP